MHEWDTDRSLWEDVYLCPATSGYHGHYLHLTVDALGRPEAPRSPPDQLTLRAQLLATGEVAWQDGAIVVNLPDFDRPGLLDVVRQWLVGNGLPVSSFLPVSHHRFGQIRRSERAADILTSLEGG